MKRIFAILLVLCVAVTMFVACGEKKEEPTTDTTTTTTETTTTETTEKPADTTTPAATPSFENAVLSVVLPAGWEAKDEQSLVMITKKDDPTTFISVMYNTENKDTVEAISTGMAAGAAVEDATIGANTFKKFASQGQTGEVVNLVSVKGTNGLIISIPKFDGADEQAILSSIVLK